MRAGPCRLYGQGMARRGCWQGLAVLGAAIAAAAATGGAAHAAADDLLLVSRADGPAGAEANGDSYTAAITPDGRHVAFLSDADNLDGDVGLDNRLVLVRDLFESRTSLASRADGPGGAEPASNTFNGADISADGRYVVFITGADNFDGDPDQDPDLAYRRDLLTGQTLLVSRANGPAGTPAGGVTDVAISADGRYVTFDSVAQGFDGGPLPSQVYRRDVTTGQTLLVSRADDMGVQGDDASSSSDISADGRYVAFDTNADNLDSNPDADPRLVYLRDVQSNQTILVSRATGATGAESDDDSAEPAISADGRYVAFTTAAPNLGAGGSSRQVMLRDVFAKTTTLASRTPGGEGAPGNGSSAEADVSDNGRYVAFSSDADNLDGDPDADPFRVYLRDLAAGQTILVSRAAGPAGAEADEASFSPAVSADGRFVAFRSGADNLDGSPDPDPSLVWRREVLGAAAGAGAVALDRVPPVLSKLSMSRRRFRVGRAPTARSAARKRRRAPVGTSFRYTLSERSTVRISIAAAKRGVKIRRRGALRCGAATRRNRRTLLRQLLRSKPSLRGRALRRALRKRRCTVYGKGRALVRAGRGPGRVKTPFSGRIGRRALRPGLHRATLTATDPAGNHSRPRRVRFRVVR